MKQRTIRWMTLLVLLAGAMVFYFSGMMFGVVALLVVGGLLELIFWSKLLMGDRNPQ